MNSKTPARISELPPKSKEILSDFFFQRNQNPSPKEIASLSKQVGLDGKRIRAWFSYKRFSEKKRASKSSGKKPTRIKELPPNLKRILSDFFQRNQNPNKQQKIDLATKVGLDLEKITRWFSDTRFQKNKKRGKGHSSGTAVEKIKPAQKKEKDPQKPPITKGEHSTFKGADRAEKLERVQSLISRVRDIKVMCTDFRAELSLEIKEFREVADYYKNELEKVLEVICVNAEEAQQAAEEYNGSCREADKKKLKIAELIKKEKEVRVLVKEKTPQQSNQKKVHWAPTPASKASYQPNTGGTRKRISFQASKCATPATNTKKPRRTPKNGDTTKQNAGLRGPTEPVEWQSLSRAKKPRPTPKNGDTTKQNAGLRGPTEPVEWQSLSGAKDDEEVTTVVFSPDHMAYQNRYCIDSLLTFTSSCIIIEGSSLDDDEEPFRLQWGIEDILYIKSQRYQNAGITMLKIHVLMEGTLQAENVECPSGTELRFAFIGTDWYGKQEAVTSLNDTFKTLWTNINEPGDTVHGYTEASFPKYFPCFYEPFEEVIYPKGEVDAVSIGKRDVDKLLPDTYVNDTIIDFYIKYLENKIDPEDRPRFHFFNSFFFRKLADPDKEPLEACKGKEAFQRVRKWTRKVNLFEKDYVFIPVNYNKHWSLIILSHLGEVATYQDEDVTKLSKVPCVLHMDPIRGNHTGLNGLMQSYLKEEWRGRVPETSEEICSRFDNLRFISLELPQQPNLFDCGLFLLHYVELFLEQAPIDFNPFKISKSVGFLNVDWFPPADASLKRVVIQRLVYDLLEAPSHVAPPVRVNDDTIHREAAVNFFPQTFNNDPSTVCQTSHDDEGIEISLLTTEPCPVGPTESLKPTFEPRSFLCMQFPSFNEATFDGYKSSLAPSLEENIENGGQSVYSVTEIDLEQDNGITPEIPYSSQNLKNSNFYEISPQTSISGCEDSLEVINSNKQMNEEVCFMEMRHEPRSPLMEHVEIQANGSTGSGESSGLESDVQHPTKKMRTTEPPLEDGSPFS